MATKSFIDTYVIERKDVEHFHNIMNSKSNIKVKKVRNHKDIKGKAILKMLNLKNE